MKKYVNQTNVTTFLAVLTVVLASGVFNINEETMKWIYLGVGLLGAFGYSTENFKNHTIIPKTEEKKEEVIEIELDVSDE